MRCSMMFNRCLALCLALGQMGNYQKLVTDQLDGTQDAYIAQFKNEYALCEAAGPEDGTDLPCRACSPVCRRW